MMTIAKYFSVLVASGNGQRCDNLLRIIRDNLCTENQDIGKSNLYLFRQGKEHYPEEYKRICHGLASDILTLYDDVHNSYFSVDRIKKMTDGPWN